MIPVKLTIQGLYSYRQKQTIQFDNLTSAGLFGLFGSVGSGKSTILEAISFALYGESERLNARDNRNYNMMNLKSNELLIDFEFKTGIDQHYRFTVSGKRNGKQFNDVKPFTRGAYKWENNAWQPLQNTTAENVTGLSYDNFRRTIIIPQGKFQEFLQLSPKDRTSMLMELFHLEKFDLASKVSGMEIRNNEQISNLNGQLQTLGELSPQEVEALQKQLVEKQNEVKQLSELALQHQQALKTLEQTKQLLEKATIQKIKLDALAAKEPDILKLEAELTQYTQLMLTFKGDMEQLENLSKKKNELEKELANDNQLLITSQKKLEDVEGIFKKVKTDFDTKDQLLKRADEHEKLVQIAQLNLKRKDQLSRLEKGKLHVDEKTNWLIKTKGERDLQKEQHDKLRQSMPDLQKLSSIKTWFIQQKSLVDAMSDHQKRIEAAEKTISELVKSTKEAMLNFEHRNLEALAIDEIIKLIEDEKNKTQSQKEKLQQSRTQQEVSRQLQTFAEALHDGEPCPLCGSNNHPHIYNATDAIGFLANIDNEIKNLDKQLKQIEDARSLMAQSHSKIQLLTAQVEADKTLQVQMAQKVNEHTKMFVWADYSISNPKQVEDEFEKAQKTAKLLDDLTKTIEESNKNIEKAEAEKEKYSKALEQIERELLEIGTQTNTLQSQIVLVNEAEAETQTDVALIQKANLLRQQHADTIARYNQTDKEIQSLLQAINQLKGNIEAKNKTLVGTANDLHSLAKQIDDKRREMGDIALEQITQVINKTLDTNAIRRTIDQWKNDKAAANELYVSLQAELNGKNFDEAAYKTTVELLNDANLKIETGNQLIGQINNKINQLQSNLAKQKELLTQLDKLKLRATNLNELKNLFRSSGFVNYVSTVYLQNLCASANDRFYKLTRNHLSLELADDNSFQVRDFMNEGQLRSVKTLSGGQTFQASLSLALALADSVRHLSAGHENFFFLDEGFGTLDREALAVVFDTLKSLRHEKRIVGVISHVDEMQQEIQTYLRITNSPEHGSTIQSSWE
jgi:exonuclease SbcC